MHGRHRKKAPRFLVFRWATAFILAFVLSVSSFATVMANTVSAVVIDGDKSYTFSMNSTDKSEILAQAEEQGMEPLSPLDVAEQVENTTTVNVRRGVTLTVTEAGKRRNLVAYRGDTVRKALEDNNIFLKDADEVQPSRDTEVSVGLAIEIRRSCRVTVAADGESREFSFIGGTVADALKEAGVSLAGKDSANYSQDEPLFDNMIIRVSRTVTVKVTADGVTKEHQVSAETVRAALKKCGVELSEDDRLNVDPKAKPTDGMEIVVTRVTTEEAQETQEVDYPIQYLTSDDMYEDETEVRTPGEKGEKIVTYKLYYVAGKLDSKEAVSEEIVKEPVAEVVVKGTLPRDEGDSAYIPDPGNGSEGTAGTFMDESGNVVPYAQKLVGTCTAYYPINPTTSTGATAGYGCIAVDPNLIPYGTRMYVTSPDGSIVYGYGVACDTGGAAMAGDIIADLCYNTEAECSIIGRRDMVVYILP